MISAVRIMPPSRLDLAAPWIAGAVLAAPVLLFRYPPMGDLPFHEALVALLRGMSDVALFPRGLYVHNWGPPNQLFYAIAWLLSLALPTDLACKVVVAGSALLIPVTAARLADHLGASRWTALLVAPLALGGMFKWGLVTNLLALPLLLGALPSLDRLAEAPTARRAAIALGWAAVLYEGHESALVVFAAAAVLFAAIRPLRSWAVLLRVSPAIGAVALAATHLVRSEHLKTPVVRAIPDSFAPELPKILEVPDVLLGATGTAGWFFAASVGALALFVIPALRLGRGGGEASARELAVRFRFELLAATCFVLYLVMPLAFGGATLVYQRFLAPAWAILIVASASRARPLRASAAARLAASGLPVAMVLLSLPAFAASSRTHRALDALFPLIEKGSAVAQLDFTPRAPSVVAPIPGAPARALATRGGRLLFSFSEIHTAPVLVRAEYDWSEPIMRLVYAPSAFCPSHDFVRFRYLLAKMGDERLRRALVVALAPEGRLVEGAGDWLLFESTLAVDPLASPDRALPRPPPVCIGQRLTKILAGPRP